MDLFLDRLKDEERVTFALRGLYEQHGYKKVRVHKFEEYSLYIDNKNFLKTENIITFMDLDGKLLALRPDVTLSIVKNLDAHKNGSFEKLYYMEKVYRLSRQTHSYKEISQIGLECIGDLDACAAIEVIRLAAESLSAVDDRYLLDLSHMGFLAGLLEPLEIDQELKQEIARCIRQKDRFELGLLLRRAGLPDECCGRLMQIPLLYGSFAKVLPAARALAVTDGMNAALDELETLYSAFAGTPLAKRLNIDFSVVNDLDYYNGLIFQGYVEGIPRAVLTGGRYDNLLHKFGKEKGAMGFAIYLDELEHFYQREAEDDADLLILYDRIDDYAAFTALVEEKIAAGMRVRLERTAPPGFRCKQILRYQNGALTGEVPTC